MDTSAAPIFIIGTERSGSNLLRLILNAHSAIAVPHPPHVLKFFTPFLPSYGDLNDDANLRRLVDDVLGLLQVHIYPWEIEVAPEWVIPGAQRPDGGTVRPRSLVGVFFALYDEYLRQSGKRRWGCKSTFVVDHLDAVLAASPEARFILLVRDPRDVAVSSRRSIFSPFHPYFTAQLWRRQQLAAMRWLDANDPRFHLLRYEDLIERPEEAVRELCRFLGEPFEPAMMEYYATPSARKSRELSTSWQNVGSPIQAKNRNTYRTGLTKTEIRTVEAVCGDLMTRFGYPLEFPAAGPARQPSPIRLLWYKVLNWYWQLGVEWQAFRKDRNYPLHWRRRVFLWRLQVQHRSLSGVEGSDKSFTRYRGN